MTPEQKKWVQQGIDKGFITKPYCDTHDAYAQEDSEILADLGEASGGD